MDAEDSGCLPMCGACLLCTGLLAGAVCFWVYGGIAVSDAHHYTEGCGLWLWISTLVNLVMFPFTLFSIAMAVTVAYTAVQAAREIADTAGSLFLSCGAGMALGVTNFLPVAAVATLAEGLWGGEGCVPHSSGCGQFAQAMCVTAAVGLGLEVLAAIVAKMCAQQ